MKDFVSVDKLTKNYGDFCAVNNLSFMVSEGEIFGFLGPNGAGKSTTLSIIATLNDFDKRFIDLTEREVEVAALVAQGCSNKEIGEVLFISDGTVRNHISSILEKTQLEHRTQIAIAYLGKTC